MSETVPDTDLKTESSPRARSFKTAKGSIYTYDGEGKTTRFKTATGEQQEPQDVTVFADLSPEEERMVLDSIHTVSSNKARVYVVERQHDESALIIRDVSQIKDPTKVYLALFRDGQIIYNKPASLTPYPGANVFDTRRFEENGQSMTERHLGNKVTEISY